MTEPLASVADLGDFLGHSFDAVDARAIRVLESASAMIRGEAHQTFTLVKDDPLVLSGTGTSNLLLLPAWPVTEVSDVVEDDVELVAVDDYTLNGASGILQRMGGVWPVGFGNITLNYSHGYAEVPDEIEALCVEVAARAFGNPLSLTDEMIGTYRATSASDVAPLTPFDRRLLARYKPVGLN